MEQNRWLENKGRHIIDILATGLKTGICNKWLLQRREASQAEGGRVVMKGRAGRRKLTIVMGYSVE